MGRALKNTKLTETFTDHNLCAKTTTDVNNLEQAAKMRGHLTTATTNLVYRRKEEVLYPLNRNKGD